MPSTSTARNGEKDLPEDFAAAWATVLLDIWQKQQPRPESADWLSQNPPAEDGRGSEEDGGHVH